VLLAVYVFDGQLQCSQARILTRHFSPNLLLHYRSIHINHRNFGPKGTINVTVILSTIFEISFPFPDMWYYHHAITTRLKQLAVNLDEAKMFRP